MLGNVQTKHLLNSELMPEYLNNSFDNNDKNLNKDYNTFSTETLAAKPTITLGHITHKERIIPAISSTTSTQYKDAEE